jgi:transcriptional regulator with XRE-family HTH domain
MSRRKTIDRSEAAIGMRLIATREALGLNQRQLCKLTGLSTNQYNQWEKGVGRPGLDGAFALADTFKLTLDWIYFGDPSKLPFDLMTKILDRMPQEQPAPTLKKPQKIIQVN